MVTKKVVTAYRSLLYALMALAAAPLLAQAGATPAQPEGSPSASGAQEKFDILEYRVLGNTVLANSAVETAVYPFLGPGKTLDSIQEARTALENAYHKAGYQTVLVDIPEQSVDAGIVRLRVTEGRVERVHINGARYFSERKVIQQLPSLKPGTVPSFPELQAQLAQVGAEARDRQVTPVLKAGEEPGTVAVDLKVQDRAPWHASLELDNRYTADTKKNRLGVTASYDNMFQRGESLSFQYQTAPEATSQVQVFALTYLGRTSDPDLTWAVYGVRSKSDVAAIGTLSVIGNGKVFGGRLTDSLYLNSGGSSSLSFGVDYKDFSQSVLLPSEDGSVTPIHYLLWSAQHNTNLVRPKLTLSTSLSLNFGVRGLGATDPEFEYNRYLARANFYYLRGSGAVTYKTWHDAEAAFRLGFQYTAVPLVNNEQFALGGVDSVRGYLEAETLDDQGVNASLELRAPPIVIKEARVSTYAFFDVAEGWIVKPLPSQINHTILDSWGFGLRTSPLPELQMSLDLASTLRAGTRTPSGDHRVHFSVKYGY